MEIISRKEAKSLGLKYYFTGHKCKHDHVSKRQVGNGYCYECSKAQVKKYATKNADKVNARMKLWREENRSYIANYNKERKDYVKAWAKENKDKILASRDRYNTKNKSNPDIALSKFIRKCLRRIEDNFANNGKRYEEIVGYSRLDLKKRIECQFKEGMSWENRSEWHIDHKKPISRFISQGVTDPKIINALSNLQPLWAHENLSKGSSF